jgi:hypothetical protein
VDNKTERKHESKEFYKAFLYYIRFFHFSPKTILALLLIFTWIFVIVITIPVVRRILGFFEGMNDFGVDIIEPIVELSEVINSLIISAIYS